MLLLPYKSINQSGCYFFFDNFYRRHLSTFAVAVVILLLSLLLPSVLLLLRHHHRRHHHRPCLILLSLITSPSIECLLHLWSRSRSRSNISIPLKAYTPCHWAVAVLINSSHINLISLI